MQLGTLRVVSQIKRFYLVFKDYFYFIHIGALPVLQAHCGTEVDITSDPLELELQMTTSHQVGVGNYNLGALQEQ